MIDQITIGGKSSFDDFGASVALRGRKPPQKKSIKETVPFSNETYDFTMINGEIYWEEQTLEYIFEIVAPTPELLESMKSAFSSWIMNIIKQELHDTIIPEYHYLATYEDMRFEDDEGLEKSTVSVSFTAYPYKIANYPKTLECTIPAKSTNDIWLLNESSHRITPVITSDKPITLKLGNISYTMPEGTAEDEAFKLSVGMNSVSITNANTEACNVAFSYYEEVF